MPFTEFIGVLTLAPAVCGLLALALGLLKRPLAPVVLALAIIGAVIPAICLILLARDLTSGEPLLAVMYGGGSGSSGSFTPGYRFDALALYAALGLAFLVTPLLLWLAWQGDTSASETDPVVGPADAETDATTDQPAPFARRLVPTSIWGGVTLALAVETAALTMLFADNALWLAVCWLALAALIWGLGEIGSEVAIIDRAGLVMMLVGPLAWLVVMLFATHTVKTLSLADMMGRSGFNALSIILFALALALAGGVYPFSAWVRRRAALITPAGLGALALVALPMTLYVGARTYAAGHDTVDLWPQIGKATPPITGGIAFIVLGAVTVSIVGMLALERRDVRVLIAYLATAQVGWGMVALGVGNAQGVLATVVILATGILGLGAMLAASVAGGTLTGDIEPDGAGPHVFGVPASRVGLIVWSLGALSLIGAPLMGGFVARELISAGAIHAGGLAIPLVGLAWAGDAVLAIAILRATAPAFTDMFARRAEPVDEEFEVEAAGDDDAEIERDEPESAEMAPATPVAPRRLTVADLRYTPGVILAALALVIGIAPQLLLRVGATLAGNALLTSSGLDTATRVSFSGYSSGPGQWLPTLSWLGVVVLVALLAVLAPRGTRVAAPALATETTQRDDEDRAREMTGLAEPVDAWDELAP
ncbi:MAG TPA: proton-conducting transporter membrane subunit, partial [Ktedonobacterales bacterium]|nr:proton-conducting transporter membrane subunit [Ktedonobacterales bacterium]